MFVACPPFLSTPRHPSLRNISAHAAPLRRNVTTDEVGNVAAFLCSDLASGITGEVVYVDAGYSQVGMSFDE